MTEERFHRVASRQERRAAENPRGYRLRVAALALLGYGYLLGLLGLVVAALAADVFIVSRYSPAALELRFGILLLILAALIVRSMWVQVPTPQGWILGYEQAAQFYDAVEQVRVGCRGPKLHQVVFTEDMNAGIVQVPRFGMLGWHRNYLAVGLPLMYALTPEQFQAVLAHEFGHLSAGHGRFSVWIHGVRAMWEQLLAALTERESRLRAPVIVFLRHYVPYFEAYTLALARQQEYEADQMAVTVAGPEVTGATLVSCSVANALDERYWRELGLRSESDEEPPADAVTALCTAVGEKPTRWSPTMLTAFALCQEPSVTDTHPALHQRLAAINATPAQARYQGGPATSAAAAFLAEAAPGLLEILDRSAHENARRSWRSLRDHCALVRGRLAELQADAAATDETHLQERLALAEMLCDDSAIESALQAIVDSDAQNAHAAFGLGLALLRRGDDAGLGYINRSMELDPAAGNPGRIITSAYLDQTGAVRLRCEEHHHQYDGPAEQPPAR